MYGRVAGVAIESACEEILSFRGGIAGSHIEGEVGMDRAQNHDESFVILRVPCLSFGIRGGARLLAVDDVEQGGIAESNGPAVAPFSEILTSRSELGE